MSEATETNKKQDKSEPESDGTRGDPTPQLLQLVELATKYPEIGAPVAELAFKVGKSDIGNRLVRMGLEGDAPRIEFYFVLAHTARRERRFADVLAAVVDGLKAFSARDERPEEDYSRLLHLVRYGFATLLFDMDDLKSQPDFIAQLRETLPALEPKLGLDPFYRTLLAQTYWFADEQKSEDEWARAIELDNTEMSWNARGTWYKDAVKDNIKAEDAYRRGLESNPNSALLLHNVAQILVDRAETVFESNQAEARRLLAAADDQLRAALREEAPKVRRHIHATRDRLFALRKKLPQTRRKNSGGGRDKSRDNRPPDKRNKGGRGGKPPRSNKRGPKEFKDDGKFRLGDMLMAKLNEAETKK